MSCRASSRVSSPPGACLRPSLAVSVSWFVYGPPASAHSVTPGNAESPRYTCEQVEGSPLPVSISDAPLMQSHAGHTNRRVRLWVVHACMLAAAEMLEYAATMIVVRFVLSCCINSTTAVVRELPWLSCCKWHTGGAPPTGLGAGDSRGQGASSRIEQDRPSQVWSAS